MSMAGNPTRIKAGQAFIAITADHEPFLKDIDKMRSRLHRFSREMMRMGGGGLLAGGGMLGGIGGMLSMYKDAETAVRRFDLIFGESADNMRTQLRKISRATSVPMTTLIGQSSSFGAIFSELRDRAGEDAFVGAVSRAQQAVLNLSAMSGVSMEEAADRMRSAFTSTGESVDQFGLNLRQAEVDAEAQRLGLNKTVRQMSELEKQMVKLSIIQRSFNRMNISFVMMANTLNQQLTLLWSNFKELVFIASEWTSTVAVKLLQGMNIFLNLMRPIARLLNPLVLLFAQLGTTLTVVSAGFIGIGVAARAAAFVLKGWGMILATFTGPAAFWKTPTFYKAFYAFFTLLARILALLQPLIRGLLTIRSIAAVGFLAALPAVLRTVGPLLKEPFIQAMTAMGGEESGQGWRKIIDNAQRDNSDVWDQMRDQSGLKRAKTAWDWLFGGGSKAAAPGAGTGGAVEARGSMVGSMMAQQMAYATAGGDATAIQGSMLELWQKVVETGGSGGAKVKTKAVSS